MRFLEVFLFRFKDTECPIPIFPSRKEEKLKGEENVSDKNANIKKQKIIKNNQLVESMKVYTRDKRGAYTDMIPLQN